MAGRLALAAWFAYWSYERLSFYVRNGVPLGQDIRIYYRAVKAWLSGGDPWSARVFVHGHSAFSYAGSPATTVVLAPSVLLSESQFTVVWLGLTALSAIAIVRWLRLPLWYLLFPPTLEALYSGNPQLVTMALVLAGARGGGFVADALAVALKVYALAPLAGERSMRRVTLALTVTLATVVLAPSLWIRYATSFSAISARLAQESANGFSAFYYPLLLVPAAAAILALWWRDRRAAGWLAVPALWPASEFHYSTFALPVMTPILAVLLAIPRQQLPPIAIVLDVAWRLGGHHLRERVGGWARASAPSRRP